MDDEVYIAVRGTIQEARTGAVLFAVGSLSPQWIPRSLIHGADERTLDNRFAGEETSLRIFAWKVKALGWQAERIAAGADRDLFGG